MGFAREKRVSLIRGLTAFLLWALIAGCFFTSVRTLSLVSQAVSYIEGRAATPQAVEEQRLAAETARGFAVEWATFDGSDAKDYSERLAAYTGGEYSVEPPAGVQRCVSASVLSVEKTGEGGLYRVKVALHVSRVVNLTASESLGVSPARRAAVPQNTGAEGSETFYPFWKDYVNCAEITVQVAEDRATVVGIPVLVPFSAAGSKDLGSIIGKDEIPQDFAVFVSQALDLYFSGKDMANFLAPDAEIKPLGGFKLAGVSLVGFESRREKAKALVRAEVSTDGVDKMAQLIVLEAVKKDRWLLERLGSW